MIIECKQKVSNNIEMKNISHFKRKSNFYLKTPCVDVDSYGYIFKYVSEISE